MDQGVRPLDDEQFLQLAAFGDGHFWLSEGPGPLAPQCSVFDG
jgi:hypothetical protein